MKATDRTRWGEFLLAFRFACAGIVLCPYLTHATIDDPAVMAALGGILASRYLTPLLRTLGWRRLTERTGDINPNPPPRPRAVERALRTSLAEGRSLQDAIRALHQTFGWDVMELSPAVVAVANLPQKEAIRLVMPLTLSAESEATK